MSAVGPEPQQAIPRPKTRHAPDIAFYEVAEWYLEEKMRLNPFVATYLGYHKYDGLMDDLSPDGVATKKEFLVEAGRRLQAVDGSHLSRGAAVDLDLLKTDIESDLFFLEELRAHEWDPQVYNDIIGYGTLYLTILEPGSPDWPARLEGLLSRMKALPGFLETARENLTDSSRVLTEFIIEQNRGNIDFFEKAIPALFEPYAGKKAHLARLLPEALNALRQYQEFLENELLPRCTGDWCLGKDLWTRKLKLTLQSDLTPEEIESRAWEHLHRERHAMLKLAQPIHDRLFPDHAHTETGEELINVVVGEVLEEASRNHSTPETLFDDCRKWVEKIKEFIREKDVITLPPEEDNFVLEPTPSFLDGMAVAFFNPAPAFEPNLKKSYWISSIPKTGDIEEDARRAESFLREYNHYGLQCLSIHEAFPGHYVQFYYALSSPLASIYKNAFASSTFAEGWAVLTEDLMFEIGYAADEPEAMLVHKKMLMRASINALLDARLHSGDMAEAEADAWALDLMQKYGFQEETEAVGKLRRAKVSSTQLSTYFVGFLEMRGLLDDFRKRRGADFSLKEFNEKVVSFGTIPPRLVRQLMKDD